MIMLVLWSVYPLRFESLLIALQIGHRLSRRDLVVGCSVTELGTPKSEILRARRASCITHDTLLDGSIIGFVASIFE